MSENIQSISQGTYTIGQTSATNFVAGPGIKIDEPSAGTVRIGNDETVLYQAPTLSGVTSCTLSESIKNFQYLGLQPTRWFNNTQQIEAVGGTGPIMYWNTDTLWRNSGEASNEKQFSYPCPMIYEWQWWKMGLYSANDDWTQLTHISGMWVNVLTNASEATGKHVGLYKVIGINRKEV